MRHYLHEESSPLGRLLLVHDDEGRLRSLDFEGYEDRMALLLRRRFGAGGLPTLKGAPKTTTAALDAYFAGRWDALGLIDVAPGGTLFQEEVWSALRAIAPGRTATYGDIAAAIGRPRAVRAVGAANGANPIALVTPCHRVIGAGGGLTGFAGGLGRKAWLLRHEGVATA